MAAMLVFGAVSLQAQTNAMATPKKTTAKRTIKKKAPVENATEREIRELRETLQNQQSQIDALKQENANKDAKLRETQQSAQGAETAAATATTKAESVSSSVTANEEAVSSLNNAVTSLKETNAGLVKSVAETKKQVAEAVDSPVALRYRGVKITPVAFFAFETVWRQRALNSDVNTPFTSTPFANAGNAHVSELNFTGRQSRVGALFEGNNGGLKLSGYVEADFLSSGTTSNNNQSNSYTLRQRQIWGQAATKSGFAVTGGQMWSLVTETKKGTDNRTENLPMTVDSQYHVGFSWLRLPAIRFQQKLGAVTTVALSLENGQAVGVNNGGANGPKNYFFGGTGNNGGLYNVTTTYTNNVAPDIIVKAAFDPKIGHFEVGGLARWFRDRYYPNATATPASAAGAVNDTKMGGGFFANGRVKATKYADVGVHFLGGDGVGRYGTSGLSDVTVHPNGTLEPLRAYQGLFSLELHPTPKLDLFGYYGGEYVQRTLYVDAKGNQVGYAPLTQNNAGCFTEGLPSGGTSPAGSCGALTRGVFEGTGGFTYRLYSSPKYGKLQYQVVYSYLNKKTWTGVGGAPKADNNMVFTGMRYYIP